MSKTRDMHGTVINEGDTVRKYGVINDESGSYKEATVKHVLPMHDGGEIMVWAGGGGAHHPKACVVVSK